MEVTLDTHSLIWYLDKGLNSKLSQKALQTIKEAENTAMIYIPIIVLMELLYLVEKGRVNLSFNKLLLTLEENNNYQIIPFDSRLLKIAQTLKGLEVHGRIILATATFTNSPIVTKDKDMTTEGVLAIW